METYGDNGRPSRTCIGKSYRRQTIASPTCHIPESDFSAKREEILRDIYANMIDKGTANSLSDANQEELFPIHIGSGMYDKDVMELKQVLIGICNQLESDVFNRKSNEGLDFWMLQLASPERIAAIVKIFPRTIYNNRFFRSVFNRCQLLELRDSILFCETYGKNSQ